MTKTDKEKIKEWEASGNDVPPLLLVCDEDEPD